MNLFADETQETLEKFMNKDWAEQSSQYISLEELNIIKNKIQLERIKSIIYPDNQDIFKVFNQSFKDIKVVIVGQDPYFNGNADGLAFSCRKSLSPSLNQIFHSIRMNI